ncbi:MAG: xanthine dehydrogenase family protein subunit M [Bacteroidetes bacterium]|nr:xanthine dehydrogenase family protein subunit M [Bacteroidota bacterium]
MAIPYEFAYEKPQNLEMAVKLLGKYGKKARLLAGGTDLANQMKQGFRVPGIIIDIKGIHEMEEIKMDGNELHIGSLATFNDLLSSRLIKENVNILHEAAGLVASNGVRNRATMVGNICSAVACMDSATPLMVHEAVIHTLSTRGGNSYRIQDWFVDNRKTAIQDDEIVTHVSIPLPAARYAGAYQKLMRYSGEDLSQANVSVLMLGEKQFSVAFGSVGPIPKRSLKIEHLLNEEGISEGSISRAKNMIDSVIAPITDVRATKEYRMHMSKVMFERALLAARERYNKPRVFFK